MKKIRRKLIEIMETPKFERAIKTFIEVSSSYVAVNVMTVDLTSRTAVASLVAGAIGSAISVVINYKVKK